jgi:hypothetical protein
MQYARRHVTKHAIVSCPGPYAGHGTLRQPRPSYIDYALSLLCLVTYAMVITRYLAMHVSIEIPFTRKHVVFWLEMYDPLLVYLSELREIGTTALTSHYGFSVSDMRDEAK